MSEEPEDKNKSDDRLATSIAMGIPFGLMAGVFLGVILDNMGLWIALGTSMGILGGVVYELSRKAGK